MQNRPTPMIPPTKFCPVCGLEVDKQLTLCPNDGTNFDDPFLQEPTLREKYEYIDSIGAGGMGVLFKARHKALNKLVAIKMVHSHAFAVSPEAYQRFEIEGRAAAALHHPFIVQIHDLGRTAFGQPYMVMDYIVGNTMADVFLEPELSVTRILKAFIQVAQALSHAHKRGVIHRDVKPSNIMMIKNDEGEEEVRIMDFGIAKVSEGASGQQLTKAGEIVGSPLYMSPEQARGQQTDARTDLYSLGCIIYEAFTGFPPHTGETHLDTIMKHLSEEPKPLADACPGCTFHPDVEKMVWRLLRKNPDARYQSMDELIVELKKVQKLYEHAPIVHDDRDPLGQSSLKRALTKSREYCSFKSEISDEFAKPTSLKLKMSKSSGSPARKMVAIFSSVFVLALSCGALWLMLHRLQARPMQSSPPHINDQSTANGGLVTSGTPTPAVRASDGTPAEKVETTDDIAAKEAVVVEKLMQEKKWADADTHATFMMSALEGTHNHRLFVTYYLAKGDCQRWLNNLDGARKLYSQGISLAKQYTPDSGLLGALYLHSARMDEEDNQLTVADKLRKDYAEFLKMHKPKDPQELATWQDKWDANQLSLAILADRMSKAKLRK